jgi:hypothetical protein
MDPKKLQEIVMIEELEEKSAPACIINGAIHKIDTIVWGD